MHLRVENVSVYVLANVPGLWNVPAVLVRVSVQVSVADRDLRPGAMWTKRTTPTSRSAFWWARTTWKSIPWLAEGRGDLENAEQPVLTWSVLHRRPSCPRTMR
jgi:hypothetical protein